MFHLRYQELNVALLAKKNDIPEVNLTEIPGRDFKIWNQWKKKWEGNIGPK